MSNVPAVIQALVEAKFAIETVAHLNGLENNLLPACEIVGEVIDRLRKLAPEVPRPLYNRFNSAIESNPRHELRRKPGEGK